jgi:DNA-binding CsgD family transcriptional regulator
MIPSDSNCRLRRSYVARRHPRPALTLRALKKAKRRGATEATSLETPFDSDENSSQILTLTDADLLLDRLESCESAVEVGLTFSAGIRTYGFLAVAAGQSSATPEGSQWTFFFNTWPTEWLKIYQERNFVRVDPAPILARLVDHPFTWRESMDTLHLSAEQRIFANWLNEIGVIDGFVAPVRYPGDDLGLCVSIAGRPIIGAAERRALHPVSLYALQKCRTLEKPGIAASVAKSPLTPREIACMHWVLEGKSDRDIGEILGVSRTTVHFHVEQVKRKLGVRTRVQAAKVVVSLGYV